MLGQPVGRVVALVLDRQSRVSAEVVKYLDSIGRERIANVLMVADMAESAAKSEAEQAEAKAHQDGQIAVEQAEAALAPFGESADMLIAAARFTATRDH